MQDDHSIRELLPAYALGSLEEREAVRVSHHLQSCEPCRRELSDYQDVSNLLAASPGEVDPPADLEDRVMERILGARTAPKTSALRRIVGFRVSGALAAVIVVALVAAGTLQFLGLIPSRTQITHAGLSTIVLQGTSAARDAYGTVVLDPEDNHGVLAVRGLPALDSSHQYQLWLVSNGARRSGGVFSVNADGYGSLQITIPADFRDFHTMGITLEPAGGSPGPTTPPVLRGSL
ncbi:MAG TPA: anti-sigma factor [Spirochaetia bacterium]|nr:anti-sigma factor [Spirochaetia bacterium]